MSRSALMEARRAGMKKSLNFFAKRTIFSYVPKKTHSSALDSELELAFSLR